MIKYLVELYGNDLMNTFIWWTPLHSACKGGQLNVAKYLIEVCNCDPKCRLQDGSSPLSLACNSHRIDLVIYLVKECNCNLINSNICISDGFVKNDTNIALFLISSSKVNDLNAGLKDCSYIRHLKFL